MAHLCLSNSLLIRGNDFTQNAQVNQIIDDPKNHCLLLYPTANSIDISNRKVIQENRQLLFPENKNVVLFVIDGTWSTAKKTLRLSVNLKKLQAIHFSPEKPSHFRVRKQPRPQCYSTIESIHHVIELFDASSQKSAPINRPQDVLLTVFSHMVEQQIGFIPTTKVK